MLQLLSVTSLHSSLVYAALIYWLNVPYILVKANMRWLQQREQMKQGATKFTAKPFMCVSYEESRMRAHLSCLPGPVLQRNIKQQNCAQP